MKHFFLNLLYGLLALCTLGGASCAPARLSDDACRLTASVPPVKYILSSLVDSTVRVEVLMPSGSSPETYEPTPAQMLQLAESKAVVRFGTLGFERTLLEALVQVAPEVPLFSLTENYASENSDFSKENPNFFTENSDPHVWTSPACMKLLAAHAAEVLASVDSVPVAQYAERLEAFQARMDALSAALHERLDSVRVRAFVIHHPSLGAWAKEFGFQQISLEAEGHEASARHVLDVEEAARATGVRVVFITPEHPADLARRVAERIGAEIIEINPLTDDYEQFLQRLAEAFAPKH